MIFMVFIFCFLHLLRNTGASLSGSVLQTPPFIIKRTNQSVASEINCSHNITNYDLILWYKQDEHKALKLLGYLNVNYPYPEDDVKGKISFDGNGRKHSSLNISDLSLSDSAVYFCAASAGSQREAYFGAGTKLTVLENGLEITRPTVKVLRPSPKECRNDKDDAKKKTIVCVASGFYPDHVGVFWDIDRENVTAGVATDEAALREGNNYTITSRLRVSVKDWFTPTKTFTCTVSFYNGTHTELYSESIEGEEAKGEAMTREKYLKITQSAKLSYAVFIAKSSIYGAFVAFLVWKLQKSAGKQN